MNFFVGLLMQLLALFGVGQAAAPTTGFPQTQTPASAQTQTIQKAAATSERSGTNTSATSGSTSAASSAALPEGAAWLSTLPLGDGKYTTSGPKKGYIYICHTGQGGGGAQEDGPWISQTSTTWTPGTKIHVQGSVAWPTASFSAEISGAQRVFRGNGLPTDHPTGTFPIQASDPAAVYDRNPNSIKAQSISYSLPAYPSAASQPGCIYGMVGIMNDGVTLFDGFDAEYRDAVAHEIQDQWEGHPEVTGEYHNHGFEDSIKNASVSTVLGFAFDGYPMTGAKLPSGKYLHTSDLDECHGITSSVELDGKLQTTYHYVLTQDFPYSVSCFHGASHEPRPGGAGASQGAQSQGGASTQGAGSPPQAAINACTGRANGASCSFSMQNGSMNGVCRTPPGQSALACVPQ